MRRREAMALLGAAAAWPLSASAQQPDRMRRIGVLIPYSENDAEAQAEVAAFRGELQQLGWIEGRNAAFESRWAAGDVARISALAKELVKLQPDAILARTTPVTAALLKETKTIPIVFVNVSDPVGAGFADSMARPGRSATGFTNVEASLGGKWVQVLKELDPQIARLGVIFDPKTSPAGGAFYLGLVQDAARSLDLETAAMPARDAGELERAIEAFAREPRGALVVQPDVTTTNLRKVIIALAARHRLPAVYPFRFVVREGGLAAYGIDVSDVYRRAAGYVDRILRGERPGELPVQAATQFELAINLATAKELGLSVSPALLARADEVIE